MTLSRQDTAAAHARHRAKHDARAWTDLADLFVERGTYHEPFFGEIQGREAIREFLRRSMDGLDDWEFPLQWTVVDEGRVVTQWFNRLPNRRRDGSPFQFTGISTFTYDDEGMILSQEDMYDRAEAVRVLAEARSPVLERIGGMMSFASGPMLRVAQRISGFSL